MTYWQTILARHPRLILAGRSGVGKTTIAGLATDRPVVNCGMAGLDGVTPDDVDFERHPHYWVERLRSDPGPWLVEGTGAFRILRTGLRDYGWEPDAAVHLLGRYDPGDLLPRSLPEDPDEAERQRRRATSRAAGHLTIWRGYRALGPRASLYEGHELKLMRKIEGYQITNIVAAVYISGDRSEVDDYRSSLDELADRVGSEVLEDLEVSAGFSMPDSVSSLIAERTASMVEGLNGVGDALAASLVDALADNDTPSEVRQRIQDIFDGVIGFADSTANSDAVSVGSLAVSEARHQAGLVLQTWKTQGDRDVRPSHADQNEETREIGKAFSNGQKFPGDPVGGPAEFYGCRCWLDAAESPAGRSYVDGPEEANALAQAIIDLREWQLSQALAVAPDTDEVEAMLASPAVVAAMGRLLARVGPA